MCCAAKPMRSNPAQNIGLAASGPPDGLIFVDDGSSDSSPLVLQDLARRDPRFRYVGLSRNFGHQVAITAGKILYVGSSNFAGWHIAEAQAAAARRNLIGLSSE